MKFYREKPWIEFYSEGRGGIWFSKAESMLYYCFGLFLRNSISTYSVTLKESMTF